MAKLIVMDLSHLTVLINCGPTKYIVFLYYMCSTLATLLKRNGLFSNKPFCHVAIWVCLCMCQISRHQLNFCIYTKLCRAQRPKVRRHKP